MEPKIGIVHNFSNMTLNIAIPQIVEAYPQRQKRDRKSSITIGRPSTNSTHICG